MPRNSPSGGEEIFHRARGIEEHDPAASISRDAAPANRAAEVEDARAVCVCGSLGDADDLACRHARREGESGRVERVHSRDGIRLRVADADEPAGRVHGRVADVLNLELILALVGVFRDDNGRRERAAARLRGECDAAAGARDEHPSRVACGESRGKGRVHIRSRGHVVPCEVIEPNQYRVLYKNNLKPAQSTLLIFYSRKQFSQIQI